MSDDPRLDRDIAVHYELGVERTRLATHFRLELVRTREMLGHYLPPPPATVFDIGGGTGAYALLLADDGYEVHLLDPVELHVREASDAWARRAGSACGSGGLAQAVVGDARDLPFQDASAAAVLLLGPLYHLTRREDRLLALPRGLPRARTGRHRHRSRDLRLRIDL